LAEGQYGGLGYDAFMLDTPSGSIHNPFSALHEAQASLSAWATAVQLQRGRLREWPEVEEGLSQDALKEVLWSWILRQRADAMMFVLATDQVADASEAVRQQAPREMQQEIAKAIANFNAACPDRRQLRNAVVHYAEHLAGRGKRQRGLSSPEAWHGLTEDLATYFYSIGEGADPLLLELDEVASAAEVLDGAVAEALTMGGWGPTAPSSQGRPS
jgi:hypothetical protein